MELVGSLGQAQRMHGHMEVNVSNPTQAQRVALARVIVSGNASIITGCNNTAKKRCAKSLWGINPGRNWPSVSCSAWPVVDC
jgi:hypothetical protein